MSVEVDTELSAAPRGNERRSAGGESGEQSAARVAAAVWNAFRWGRLREVAPLLSPALILTAP